MEGSELFERENGENPSHPPDFRVPEPRRRLPEVVREANDSLREAANRLGLAFHEDNRFLFWGDLEKQEIEEVVKELTIKERKSFFLMIAPHHGTHWQEGLRSINSWYTLSSIGERLMPNLQAEFVSRPGRTLVTYRDGDIVISPWPSLAEREFRVWKQIVPDYLYPTRDGWIEDMISEWRNSGKGLLSFSFLKFYPTTLPEEPFEPFWMFLYFSKNKTYSAELRKKIPFRVRVIEIGADGFRNRTDVFQTPLAGEDKIWFLCDCIQEIRNHQGEYLTEENFSHCDRRKNFLCAIRNSVAPVRCNAEIHPTYSYP